MWRKDHCSEQTSNFLWISWMASVQSAGDCHDSSQWRGRFGHVVFFVKHWLVHQISFGLLTESQRFEFQTNLLKTMLQLEDTYFSLARTQTRNCLVICDRGAMDCSAYLPKDEWERILEMNNYNEVDLRDNRYHQVIHLVTAAKGAEEHYTRSNNNARQVCEAQL